MALLYLASSLRLDGHEVEILDCRQKGKATVHLPAELSYLQDFYPYDDRSPFKLYSGYYHFGMGWREIRQHLEGSKADVFGISSSFTPYHQEALEVARIIKALDKRKIVVMGGAHVSCAPEAILESPWVDFVVLGEGEVRFPLLLKEIEKNSTEGLDEIDGIGYRRDGKIRMTPLQNFIEDLDALPYPSRELLPPDRYRIRGLPSTMILTSRGCPHRCSYCSAHLLMGTAFRTRSPEKIVEEMVECREKYGTRIFDIEDDNFTFDRERAKRLMRRDHRYLWREESRVDGDERRLLCFAGRGTAGPDEEGRVSTRSISPSSARMIGRRSEWEGRRRIGVSARYWRMSSGRPSRRCLCDPRDARSDHRRDGRHDPFISWGKGCSSGPAFITPRRGPLFLSDAKPTECLPPHPSQWRSSAFPIETRDFDRLDLVTLFRTARAINFIKAKIDKKEIDEGTTWSELQLRLKDLKKEAGSTGWGELLRLLFEERSFFGLKRDSGRREILFKERSSKKVLDCFFEKAWHMPILGSRQSGR